MYLVFGVFYYLRMFIYVVKGFIGFEYFCIVGSIVYEEFRDVCYVRGLFDDDKEWYEVIEELSYWVIGW